MKPSPHNPEMHKEIMKALSEMTLHQESNIAGKKVIRVPGGWIYLFYSDNCAGDIPASTFVPLPEALKNNP